MEKKQPIPQAQGFILAHLPEEWPTLDEFPETDTSDLVRTYQANIEPED